MNLRVWAAVAALSATMVSAQAGTIVFHVGDPTRPTVGVDGWSTSTTGDLVSLNASHIEHAVLGLGPDVYVEQILGTFSHSHYGAYSNTSPPSPEMGTEAASGMTTGSVFWWFEYIPDGPLDVPDMVNPYYADIQTRGQATVFQIGRSANFPVTGSSVNIIGGINGLLTLTGGNTVCPAGGRNQNTFTTGSPWNLQENPSGFGFTWNAALGKWLGKPQFLNAAGTLFNSMITLGDDAEGHHDMSFDRQLKVLRVRTPGGQTFTFNNPWI